MDYIEMSFFDFQLQFHKAIEALIDNVIERYETSSIEVRFKDYTPAAFDLRFENKTGDLNECKFFFQLRNYETNQVALSGDGNLTDDDWFYCTQEGYSIDYHVICQSLVNAINSVFGDIK